MRGAVAVASAALTRRGPATGGLWGQDTARAAERTLNMPTMSMTLDVSKLSGWLKAVARCRVESRACDEGGGVCRPGGAGARVRGAVAVASAALTRRGPATGGLWGQDTRGGAHVEHAAHVRDAGHVEAQRLVEGRRALPSPKQGACGARGEVCESEGAAAAARA